NEGALKALRRSGFVARKRMEEMTFARWLESDPAHKQKYGEVLPELTKVYQQLNATAVRDLVVPQIFLSSSLLTIAVAAREAAVNSEKAEANSAAAAATARTRARDRAIKTLADRNVAVERHLLTYLLRKAANLPVGQKIEPIEKRFAGLQGNRRRRAEEDFVRTIVDVDRFAAAGSIDSFFKLSTAQLSDLHEPFVDFATELGALLSQQRSRPEFTTIGRYRQLLFEGLVEMNGKKPYPDANRTLRFTYGKVQGFASYDAKVRPPFTNLAGTLEKDQGREPFDVPEKLKQLYRTRDFGQYATADGTNVPVNFLADTDIINGNSGSPVLNGRGEQVGIIFDNNYEGLGNSFFYNRERGRSIAVDIRYVLFVVDKFGGAGYLLKELDLHNKMDRLQSEALADDCFALRASTLTTCHE
ncbi:MAG TPA: S46 family peptidase, partial [Pyrinomonadaceae bacterium]